MNETTKKLIELCDECEGLTTARNIRRLIQQKLPALRAEAEKTTDAGMTFEEWYEKEFGLPAGMAKDSHIFDVCWQAAQDALRASGIRVHLGPNNDYYKGLIPGHKFNAVVIPDEEVK